MVTIKIDNKAYNIKFSYEATLKSHILSELVNYIDAIGGQTVDFLAIEDVLLFLPKFLLVGLQKYHKDEFGFVYGDKESMEQAITPIFPLLENYFDVEENDPFSLFNLLNAELMSDGFLAKILAKEEKAREKKRMKREAKTTS